MIKILKKTFWFPFSSNNQIEKYQKEIRDIEWSAFKKYILKETKFLDVGCGSGDNLTRAKVEFNCQVIGIDPLPGAHGVGRYSENVTKEVQIIQGNAEKLPFQNEEFDIVFCSHVLEHVINKTKSLSEMNRVLKKDGVLIIGMPTATMAIISILSHYLFTTHVNIMFLFKNLFTKEVFKRFIHILIPISHSYPNHRFVSYDLLAYRIKHWEKIIKKEFEIKETLTPCLYPYPDFIQWFPKKSIKGFSSSVFFICKKK
jgi:ubiquinone/menaquinone biosynthesis C-methylase UbiE